MTAPITEFKGHKVFGFKTTKYGVRVDVELHHSRTTADVWWSLPWSGDGGSHGGHNSYVLVANPMHDPYIERQAKPGQPLLASINGVGEVRWYVTPRELEVDLESEKQDWWNPIQSGERLAAARYFGLID